jgi:hypothetical protein
MNNGTSNGGVLTGTPLPAPQSSLGRFGVAGPEQLHLDREPGQGPGQKTPRRRWLWALAGLATAAVLCAGAFAAGRVTKPAPPAPAPPPPAPATAGVVALAQPVTEGQALSSNDLRVITIVTGPGAPKGSSPPATELPYFPALMETRLVGQHVRSDLPSGALLMPTELTNTPFPAKGQALVGLDLQPSESPTGGALLAGDHVGVLFVPAASQPPYPAPKPLVTAQVVASVAGQSGNSYVTVLVPAGIAAQLAAYAQHDEVALVRLGPAVPWPPPTAHVTRPAAPKTVPVTTTPKRAVPTTTVPLTARRAAPPTTAHHGRVARTAKAATSKTATAKTATAKTATAKTATAKTATAKTAIAKTATGVSATGTKGRTAPSRPARTSAQAKSG